jgi:TatD DNase family protein
MTLCDAHCHLANLSQTMPLKPLFAEAQTRGIIHYLSSALTKADLTVHPKLQQDCPGTLLYSAGIHPSFDECDLSLQDIIALCEKQVIWAIGEIGLDKANPDKEGMTRIFVEQLELANSYPLPVVLHIVGHQQEAFDILRKYPLRYLLHGYAGSLEAFHKFTRLDCFFTISERILREDKRDLLMAMLESGRYLFETDITQYYVHAGELNPLLRLPDVLRQTAVICGWNIATLTAAQAQNYEPLTGYSL